jgi:hypothetical protein
VVGRLGVLLDSRVGERAALAAGRLSARPRGGRGVLNRARAQPAVTEGDDGQDATELRHSSVGAHTAGSRTDRRSAAYSAATGKSRHLGCGFDLVKARGPRAVRDLGLRSVRRCAGVDAEGAAARARARRCGATSWRRARPTRFYFAEPQFEQEELQKFE